MEKPRKTENKGLVSPSRKRCCAPVGFSQGFLSKEQCDTTVTAPSPYTLLTWLQLICFLFLRLKSTLKERRSCYATDINKNATEELKRLSQKTYRDVSKTFRVAGRSVPFHKATILEEIWRK